LLTPERVGGTFFQRTITVYMNTYGFDKPVINLHELTEGLIEVYNHEFDSICLESMRFENVTDPGHQSLSDKVELLKNANHYVVARLSEHDLSLENHSTSDKEYFYQYLDKNFYIIKTSRTNMFEYALSWAIAKESNQMNVETLEEKHSNFSKLYKEKINIDIDLFLHHIYQYKSYTDWADKNFTVDKFWNYEKHMPDIENFIQSLGIFKNGESKSWKEIFGISFNDWNRCHYLLSDISGVGKQIENPSTALLEYKPCVDVVGNKTDIVKTVQDNLTVMDRQFLHKHKEKYTTTKNAIEDLIKRRVIPSRIPIKLQTFLEKCMLAENLPQLVTAYNDAMTDPHCDLYGMCNTVDLEQLKAQMKQDFVHWHVVDTALLDNKS